MIGQLVKSGELHEFMCTVHSGHQKCPPNTACGFLIQTGGEISLTFISFTTFKLTVYSCADTGDPIIRSSQVT